MLTRDILIYFALKYRGSWEDIYRAILSKEKLNAEDVETLLSERNASALTILDEDYPACMKNIFHPPFVLFFKGNRALLKKEIVSVVGSRSVSRYGFEATRKIVHGLKEKNCAVCSGMARGVDKAAHEEALKNGIPTIGVLPCGIERCYPKENASLYREVEERGLLISEYPGSVSVAKERFSFRNRLIAALGFALVVAHIRDRSGTAVTVRYALEYGKDIYCVPYPIEEDCCCNRLIKDGAYLIDEGEDIFPFR